MSIIIETSMNFCSKCGSAELAKKIPEGDNLERFVCNKCGEIHYQNPNIVTGVLAYTDQNTCYIKSNYSWIEKSI